MHLTQVNLKDTDLHTENISNMLVLILVKYTKTHKQKNPMQQNQTNKRDYWGKMGSLIFTRKSTGANQKHFSGILIACVPFCSFSQQHNCSQPQVLAANMKQHSTFKSKWMLEALSSTVNLHLCIWYKMYWQSQMLRTPQNEHLAGIIMDEADCTLHSKEQKSRVWK